MNTQASEKVVFSKPAGVYLLRVIIDSNLKNNMSGNSNIEVKDKANHTFKVDCANIYTNNILTGLDISIKPYELINADNLTGKWILRINNIKLEAVKINMLETGTLSEFAPVVISDKSGNALLNGDIDRLTNTLHIKGMTLAFYNIVKDNFLEDARNAHCDWFYHNGFAPVFNRSQNSSYVASPQLLYYFTTYKNIVCEAENIAQYDEKNFQLSLTLER